MRHLRDAAVGEDGLGTDRTMNSTVEKGAVRWMVIADGQRLQQLRHQHGLSQQKLADRAGISLTTVGRLERQGRRSCRGRTLARIAAALGEHPNAICAS
jgi:DNA-binding XRE family transcriptional regulator